jgi:hypothetical protein
VFFFPKKFVALVLRPERVTRTVGGILVHQLPPSFGRHHARHTPLLLASARLPPGSTATASHRPLPRSQRPAPSGCDAFYPSRGEELAAWHGAEQAGGGWNEATHTHTNTVGVNVHTASRADAVASLCTAYRLQAEPKDEGTVTLNC